ncbi:MAG: hypothetical protein ACPGIA_03920 [Luteolibacter sp.]
MQLTLFFAIFFSFSFSVLGKAQNIDAVERKLGEAVAEGALTLKQAAILLDTLHEIDEDDGYEKRHGNHLDDAEKKLEVWVERVGDQIEEAVEEGDLTEEEGWTKWKAFKKEQLIPKLKFFVKEGRVGKEWSRDFIKAIEKEEMRDDLKSAVAKGDMTEEEAWKKWESLYRDESKKTDDH